jgi:hypothetical protein
MNAVLVRLYYRGLKVEHRMIDERDIYLIRNYQLQEDQLSKLHINAGELTAKAHERGLTTSTRWKLPSSTPMARST